MESIYNHSYNYFRDNKPENNYLNTKKKKKEKFKPQIHLDYVIQYLIQQYK